jgi:hypothetical protein
MNTLLELSRLCEEATGPDVELDKQIHSALFGTGMGTLPGGKVAGPFYLTPEGLGRNHPYAFTGSVEDAEIALPDDGSGGWPEWQITRRYCTGYHASIGTGNDGVGCCTPALALCAAALKARGES